jgi:gamma-glutamylputrescine oxidase
MFSIWEKETFYAPQDVVIIGSGLVGLWSALFLKKRNPELKITILDRGIIPTGASTRNAGFACFGSLSELVYDAKMMGTEKMLELVEMRYKGLERIQKYFSEKAIDFNLCGGYELYDDNNVSTGLLQENIDYLNSLLKPIVDTKRTYRIADERISEFGFGNTSHLVKNNLEGYVHSGKLIQALLHKVQGMGVQIFTSIETKGFEHKGQTIEITTTQPFGFTANQLLICTNAFAKDLLPEVDIIPARGQVLLTSAIEGLPWKGTFHSDEGYYYFRNLGNKVLLGGARNKAFDEERTTNLNTSDTIQQHLENYLADVVLPKFKGQYKIEHRWAGIMGMGSEKMPIVKQLEPNVFCAIRMSGMGVALAPVVGEQVARMMKGKN